MNSEVPCLVKRTPAPVASGYLIVIIDFLIKYVPGLARYLASDAGFFSLRQLPPNLLKLDITTLALPPRRYMHNHRTSAGESLCLEDFAHVSARAGENELVSSIQIHQAFVAGKNTPIYLAQKLIAKLESANQIGPRGFMHEVHEDDVIAQAEASAKRFQSGKPLSVLDGIPVVIKNEIDVKGYVTRVGSSFINGETAAVEDGEIVKQLKEKGAIILGVTNLPEVGYTPIDVNPRNPWNPKFSCGGSSSGSAGAVAAGYCPIAVGCDGGGSIRIPAAFCGVYGLKPTHQRVSAKGEFPGAPTVALAGPIAGTANDLCIGYLSMADRNAVEFPPVHVPKNFFSYSVAGLRVGIMRDYNLQVFNPAITKAMQSVESELVKNGAILVPIVIPFLEEIRVAHMITIASELTAALQSEPNGDNGKKMTHSSSINSSAVNQLGTRDYIHAQKLRTHAIQTLCELFDSNNKDRIDLILTPTTAVTAPKLPEDVRFGYSNVTLISDVIRFVFLANFTGAPAVSCPVGLDDAGLPIGVQFMGEWWSEGMLLGISKWMESVFGGSGRRSNGWNGVDI